MKKKLKKEEYVSIFKKTYNDLYDFSLVEKEELNSYETIYVICKKHNKAFSTTPMLLLRNEGCPYCKADNDAHKFMEKFNNLWHNVYSVDVNSYIDDLTPIKVVCHEHGSFSETPKNLLKGVGCPVCGRYVLSMIRKRSSLETSIMKFLIDNKIDFIHQWKIYDKKLFAPSGYHHVDFYIPKYNMAIEANGIQHYKSIEYFGGIDRYIRNVNIDNGTRQYCKSHKINLIEIKYNQIKKIGEILNHYLCSII